MSTYEFNPFTKKLDSIGAGGGGSVDSVNGQTGVVTLTKSDVGLANSDNTSDANKPVSTATQTALDAKVPITRTINGQALSSNITLDSDDILTNNSGRTVEQDLDTIRTQVNNLNNLGQITIVVDGGGGVLGTGVIGDIEIEYDCTITQATLLADQSGSVVIDIFKCTYAQYDAGSTHPVSGDKITASAPPTISSATKSKDATLTGWTISLSAGNILRFNVNSATTITRATLILKVTK